MRAGQLGLVSVLLVACGAQQSTRVRINAPTPEVDEPVAKVLPKPKMEPAPVVDLLGLLPPQTVTRAGVYPHFASVKAAWPEVCERRGRLHDDVLAYVTVWWLSSVLSRRTQSATA